MSHSMFVSENIFCVELAHFKAMRLLYSTLPILALASSIFSAEEWRELTDQISRLSDTRFIDESKLEIPHNEINSITIVGSLINQIFDIDPLLPAQTVFEIVNRRLKTVDRKPLKYALFRAICEKIRSDKVYPRNLGAEKEAFLTEIMDSSILYYPALCLVRFNEGARDRRLPPIDAEEFHKLHSKLMPVIAQKQRLRAINPVELHCLEFFYQQNPRSTAESLLQSLLIHYGPRVTVNIQTIREWLQMKRSR